MKIEELISLLEFNIKNENQNEIRKICDEILEKLNEIYDTKILIKISELYEETGIVDMMKKIYEKLFELEYETEEIMLRYAECCYESGDIEKAEKFFRKILKKNPEHKSAKEELKNLLIEKEEFGIADAIISDNETNIYQMTDNNDTEEIKIDKSMINKEHINKLKELFFSREDVYALQWINNNFETGYKPVYGKLTDDIIIKHLAGELTLGSYCLDTQNNVCWSAFDLDIPKKQYLNISGENQYNDSIKNIFKCAKKIFDECSGNGIYPYIELSGNKGCHIWFFWEEKISAYESRIFMQKILNESQCATEGVDIEIFPKQNELKSKKLGNLVKVPVGLHQKTNKRAVFCDVNGQIFSNQLDYMLTIERKISKKVLEVKTMKTNSKQELKSMKIKIENFENDVLTAVKTDNEKKVNPFTNKDLKKIRTECGVIKYIIDKLIETGELTYDEKISLIWSISFIENGKEILKELFKSLTNYSAEKTILEEQINAVSKCPVSCKKLRKKIRPWELNISCACRFEDNRLYDSPVLHINKLPVFGEKKQCGSVRKKSDFRESVKTILPEWIAKRMGIKN